MKLDNVSINLTPTVQLFILCRDRLVFSREAVASAIAQTYLNCEVIVSDNSVGPEVSEMLARDFPSVKVIRRSPPVAALCHFNQLINEAEAKLMVMFHDDDVLNVDYVEEMVNLFQKNPEIVAAGCNALILTNNRLTHEKMMGDFRGMKLISSAAELAESYLSIGLFDPAPFPGYMYRSLAISGLMLESDKGGKHSDVSFLCQVVERGPMLWTGKCLFKYRIHNSNDSGSESIPNRLSWLRYILKNTGINRHSTFVADYKFMYWRRWLNQNSAKISMKDFFFKSTTNRHSIVIRFVYISGLRLALTRVDFWRRGLRMLYRRIF